MPAKSKSQQRLFGMALAVRRKELKRSEVEDSVLDIVDSDMTDKQIEDFAKTSGLSESKYISLKDYIYDILLNEDKTIELTLAEIFAELDYNCITNAKINMQKELRRYTIEEILDINNLFDSIANGLGVSSDTVRKYIKKHESEIEKHFLD